MGVILLVRHGQASFGTDDYDRLSDTGHRQSAEVGNALSTRGFEPDVVISGSMRRHVETATAALSALGVSRDVTVDEAWNEFDYEELLNVHMPDWRTHLDEAMRDGSFRDVFGEAMRRWAGGEFDDEYGESFTSFTGRVEDALRRTSNALDTKQSAIVFTSGGPIAWVAARLLGQGADVWARLNPVTVNASVTKVVVGSRGATLVSVNDHSHLEAAGSGLLTYR